MFPFDDVIMRYVTISFLKARVQILQMSSVEIMRHYLICTAWQNHIAISLHVSSSFWLHFRQRLHRKLSFDNFRCRQRWKFHQNDMLVSMHQCVTFADFHCSRLMVMHVWIHINIWDKRDFIRVFVYLYRHDPEASFYSGGCLRFEHCLHLYFFYWFNHSPMSGLSQHIS